MRALLVLVLLAGSAHADDDYDPLIELRRSFENRDGYGCQDHLATLRATGVPDSTTIYLFERAGIRRGYHSLGELRRICENRLREHARDQAAALIRKAIEFPWVWAEQCIDRWPLAIAAGAQPSERVEMRVRSRRGYMNIAGTLEQLYVKHCENAYTPRRRGDSR